VFSNADSVNKNCLERSPLIITIQKAIALNRIDSAIAIDVQKYDRTAPRKY